MPRISIAAEASAPPARRFTVANTIDGYEVVDNDGRTVSNCYDYAGEALEIAGRLNDAAVDPQALRRALGAMYEEDQIAWEQFLDEDEYPVLDSASLDW